MSDQIGRGAAALQATGSVVAVRLVGYQDLPDEHNTFETSEIVCRERLGGLIKSFERSAA
jgi:hypothetical protein